MSKHGTAPEIQVDQFAEFAANVVRSLPRDIDPTTAQAWIGNARILSSVLRGVLVPPPEIASKIFHHQDLLYQDLLSEWQKFYFKLWDKEFDFSGLRIPEKREGFSRLLVMTQGMTAQQLYNKCSELFSCEKYADRGLDEAVPTNGRTADNGHYAIWVRNRVEADKELKNMSANTLEQKGIPGITLAERELYELKYFDETGRHLDIKGWTLCAGSRDSAGNVPGVYWYPYSHKMHVYWYSPDYAHDDLRSREVVS